MGEIKKVPEIRFNGFESEWEETFMGDLYNFQYGYFNNNPSNGGKYPIYGANGVIGGFTDYNSEDAVVIGHMGEYAGVVLWANGKHFVTYNGIITKPASESLDAKFGYFLLKKENIRKICGGSGQPFLSYDMLNKIATFYPSRISEQIKISDFFQNLDNSIKNHNTQLKKLTNLKKAMLIKMFPQDGASVPEIRFKGFDEEWEEKSFSNIINLNSGRDYKHLEKGGIPVYGTGGYMLSVNEALSYDENAIGIGRKGTIDKPYILKAPFWTVDTLFYAIPIGNNDLDFINCLFQKTNWKQKDESTGVPSLSKVTINNTCVSIPKENEQKEIGSYFRTLDSLIENHKEQLKKLDQIKKACLSKLFVSQD